jgi:hypothetical protein
LFGLVDSVELSLADEPVETRTGEHCLAVGCVMESRVAPGMTVVDKLKKRTNSAAVLPEEAGISTPDPPSG